MKLSTIPSSLAVGVALALGSALLTPSSAGEARAAPAGERQWLSIPQVVERLEAAGYSNVEKIEREHGSYKVRATDPNGERTKLHAHPQTGEIIDRSQGQRARARDDGRQRQSADCTRRRCRDDLPPAAAPAAAAAPRVPATPTAK